MAEVPKGKSLEDVRDTMLSVLERVGEEGVTAEEVERARQQLLKQRDLAADDPNRIAIQLSDWAAQGDWRLYFLDRDRIEQVTPEQVKAVARNYLRPSNRTIGLFIPTDKAERTPVPATPDLAAMVENYKGRDTGSAGESFDVAPARIEARVQRPEPLEGIKVALLPKKTRNEAVQLELNLRYGNAENLKGLVEAASFLPTLMLRGTKQLSRQQIQDTLDRNRARLSLRGGPGPISVSIETRRSTLPAVLEVLRQVLREPTLPAERVRDPQERAARPARTVAHRALAAGHRSGSRGCWRRILPTTSATRRRSTRRSNASRRASLDQVKTLYDAIPRRRAWRTRGRRRLRTLGDPAAGGQGARLLEGREAVCADRAAVPGRSEAPARDDPDSRQGERHLLRGPDGCRSATTTPTTRPWSWATRSWEEGSRRASPTGSGTRGASPTAQAPPSPPAPSTRRPRSRSSPSAIPRTCPRSRPAPPRSWSAGSRAA